METILVINDSDVGLETKQDADYKPRTAARAILRKGDKIALLHVTKHNYYKLPGGGVDDGESIKIGLDREIMEETGCTSKVHEEVGEIVEHRSQLDLVQTSHCFVADVINEGKPEFTEEEIEDGFELVWVTTDEAMNLVKTSKPDTYDGKFIVIRDLKFLEEFRKMIFL